MSAKPALIVKPYSRTAGLSQGDAQEKWSTLSNAIDEIYNRNASVLSYEELYRFSYNLVLHKFGTTLYSGVEQKINDKLTSEAARLSQTPSDDLLSTLAEAWEVHKTVMNMIKDILMYLDRTFVVQNRKLPVFNLSLKLFRGVVIYHPHIRDRLRNLLLDNILEERKGCIIDRSVMKVLLLMLKEVGIDGVNVYEEEFESHFLAISTDFYRLESQDFLQNNSVIDYIYMAERRIEEEEQRLSHYLIKSTGPKLKQMMDQELITAHCRYIIGLSADHSGAISMMNDNKLLELKQVYTTFARVPSTLEVLRDAFGEHVRNLGCVICDQFQLQKDPLLLVKELLALKEKYETIITKSFGGDKKAMKKLKEVMDFIVNRGNSCAQPLAAYLDDFLKNGLKESSELETEQLLDSVISLFKHLSDKDLFENYYKNLLSKRLLSDKSISDDAEKLLFSKLKAECGYQYTNKLEGMFRDVSMSKVVMEEYHASGDFVQSSVELDVQVLTAASWPQQLAIEGCRLPAEIEASCELFSRYYLNRNSGRKLVWVHSLGTADIKVIQITNKLNKILKALLMCGF